MRELSASAVQIAQSDEPEQESDTVLSARLQDGRRVDAVFDKPIEDRAALARRLQMLVAAFESALAEPEEGTLQVVQLRVTQIHQGVLTDLEE